VEGGGKVAKEARRRFGSSGYSRCPSQRAVTAALCRRTPYAPDDRPNREEPDRPPGRVEEKPRNLKNRACKVAGASLGSTLFLGKPLKAVAWTWPPPKNMMIYGS